MKYINLITTGIEKAISTLIVCMPFYFFSPISTNAAEQNYEECQPLFEIPLQDLEKKLMNFEKVYGKESLDWNENDFTILENLIAKCDQTTISGTTIMAEKMIEGVEKIKARLFEVKNQYENINEMIKKNGKDNIVYPKCWDIIQYEFKPWENTDNSKDIFGVDFMAMTTRDIYRSVLFINECSLIIQDYAAEKKGWTKPMLTQFLNGIMDRGMLIIQRRRDWDAWGKKPTDLTVNINGAVIPPTMTSNTTREMILRYNRASAIQKRFTPETIMVLLNMADEVLEENKSAWDVAYANAVKKRVNEDIFKKPSKDMK